jgi:hypothetical protein
MLTHIHSLNSVKLKKFQSFSDVTTALQAATSDAALSDPLAKFLQKNLKDKKVGQQLAFCIFFRDLKL